MEKNKNTFSIFNIFTLRLSVKISVFISLFTQICFFAILLLAQLIYRWIGGLLHLSAIIIALISIRCIYEMTTKAFLRLRVIAQISGLFEIAIIIYYAIQIVIMCKNDTNFDLIMFFVFSLIILGLFKGLLITAIFLYVKSIQDRPMMMNGKKQYDQNLNDMKIKQLKEDLFST